MERKVTKIVQGKRTKDGAGVSLVRILGQTSKSRTGNSQLDKTLISLNSQPSTLITSHLSQLSTLNSLTSQLYNFLNLSLSLPLRFYPMNGKATPLHTTKPRHLPLGKLVDRYFELGKHLVVRALANDIFGEEFVF